jgi:enoyl-CoA hydratase/carnithine racemase
MTGTPGMAQYELVKVGMQLCIRMFGFRRPFVMGCSGHGLALGAIVLLAGDVRVGKRGPKFKLGLNEVAIGMTVPVAGVEMARHKMPKSALSRAVTQGTVYTTDEAVTAGYLDMAVDEADFLATCMAEAERLATLKNPGVSHSAAGACLHARRIGRAAAAETRADSFAAAIRYLIAATLVVQFSRTKDYERGAIIKYMEETLLEDMARLLPKFPSSKL